MSGLLRAAVAGVVFACSLAQGATIFVDASRATGANDGTSWANAFQGRLGLVSALASANPGDEVWVADGVYAPAPSGGDRNLSFVMRSGVVILGGFAGDETSANQRGPGVNVAFLTGDLDSDDGVPNNGITPNSDDNSFHVVRFEGVAGAILDGVTVRAGVATPNGGFLDMCGGNVRVVGGDATIRACVIERGRAGNAGGGIVVFDAAATIEGCLIRLNRGDDFGSGVAVLDNANVVISDCDFDANYCGQGAGMYLGTASFNADPSVVRGAAIVERTVFRNGNGIIGSSSGGAVFNNGGALVMRECAFENNAAQRGGGALYLRGGSAHIDRCDFVGNEAPGDGGGAAFVDGNGVQDAPALFTNSRFVGNNGAFMVNFNGAASVVNCDIVSNSFGFGFLTWPAFVCTNGSTTAIANTIVWNNMTGGTFGVPEHNLVGSGAYAITTSIIAGALPAMGSGALNVDPMFVDLDGADGVAGTVDDDLRLLPGSPARDAGDDGALPVDVALDFFGAARVIDGDHDGAPVVDIGAIEAPCPGDASGDGVVDFGDLNAVLSVFGAGSGSSADVNFDGAVDFADLNAVLSVFGADCR